MERKIRHMEKYDERKENRNLHYSKSSTTNIRNEDTINNRRENDGFCVIS